MTPRVLALSLMSVSFLAHSDDAMAQSRERSAQRGPAHSSSDRVRSSASRTATAVSYTHLPLPTIYSV